MSTLLHPNCPDNPCVDCSDCWIIESGCYVKWFCVASTVQVFGPGGSLRSTDNAGQIFRPSYGRWELWACNGIGCTPQLVATVEVGNWQEADCECCIGNDFVRYQISNPGNYELKTEQFNRDERGLVPGVGLVGNYYDEISLSERIVFNHEGSFLRATTDPGACDHLPFKIGDGTYYENGRVTGTITRQDATQCPLNIETYVELQVDIYLGARAFINGETYLTLFWTPKQSPPIYGYSLYSGCVFFESQPVLIEFPPGLIPYARTATPIPDCGSASQLFWGDAFVNSLDGGQYTYFRGRYLTGPSPGDVGFIGLLLRETPQNPAAPFAHYARGTIEIDFI